LVLNKLILKKKGLWGPFYINRDSENPGETKEVDTLKGVYEIFSLGLDSNYKVIWMPLAIQIPLVVVNRFGMIMYYGILILLNIKIFKKYFETILITCWNITY